MTTRGDARGQSTSEYALLLAALVLAAGLGYAAVGHKLERFMTHIIESITDSGVTVDLPDDNKSAGAAGSELEKKK
jgi:hypothetical protein